MTDGEISTDPLKFGFKTDDYKDSKAMFYHIDEQISNSKESNNGRNYIHSFTHKNACINIVNRKPSSFDYV